MYLQKESILSSILKRFTGAFAAVFGALLALFLLLFIGGSLKMSNPSAPELMTLKVQPINQLVAHPFSPKKSVLLQINIEGVIGKDPLLGNQIQAILAQPELYKFSEGQIKGILLKINSPGGSVSACSQIYNDLMHYKRTYNVPIHTWIGDMCASGGVYISSASDFISSQKIAAIGSVGVKTNPNFNFYDWMQKQGISQTTVAAGKHKIHFPMFSKMPPGTSSYDDFIAYVEFLYEDFIDVVVRARGSFGLTRERLLDIGATIHTPIKAKELGFIDAANVRYDDAVTHLAKTLNLEEYQVITFQNSESFMDQWKKSIEAKIPFIFSHSSTEIPFSFQADFN
jgi:protease-4